MAIAMTCQHCGASYTVSKYRVPGSKYCSRRCLGLATRVLVKSNCGICGNQFEHISCRLNKAKYCSRACYYTSLRERGKTEYTCRHCRKKFMGHAAHHRVYCSRACVSKAAREHWRPVYTTVRKAMTRRNMLVRCERCGWDEMPEILGVHHRDRDRKNNDRTNLEVLCPNCHSVEHRKHIPRSGG